MKNKNILTFVIITWVVLITLMALSQSTNAPDEELLDETTQDNTPLQESYIWMSVVNAAELAEKKWDIFRVVNIDGEPQPVTMDYRPGRINASIVDGIVTEFSIEGEGEEK